MAIIKSINIKYPLQKSNAGGFATNRTTIEAITDDLRILILSNYGERPIHYDFGANLRKIVFEQGRDLPQKINNAIRAAVNKWMPFVNILSIDVLDSSTNSTLQDNEVRIRITFAAGQLQGVLEQNIRA